MSVLFIHMLYRRRSLRGQSISIALCKLIGTALASLAFVLYVERFQQSILLPFLYGAILLYDVIYVGLVYVQQHAETRERRTSTTEGEHFGPSVIAR